jgi:hypothetical protein
MPEGCFVISTSDVSFSFVMVSFGGCVVGVVDATIVAIQKKISQIIWSISFPALFLGGKKNWEL